jgi:hypothetical protein
MQQPARRVAPGGALMVIGGIVYLVAGVLQWGRATVTAGGNSVPVKITGGGLAFILGGALVLFGLLRLFVGGRGLRLLFAILGILAALAAAGASLYFAVSKAPFESTWASACADKDCLGPGLASDAIEKELKTAIANGQVQFDASRKFGLYVALAGGIVGLIGGVMAVGGRGKREELAPPPPPPGAAWPAQPSSAPVAPPVAPEGTAPPPPPPPSAPSPPPPPSVPSPPPPPSDPSPPPPPPNPPPPPPGEPSA